MQPGKENPLLV